MRKILKTVRKAVGKRISVFFQKEADFDIPADVFYGIIFALVFAYGILIYASCEKAGRQMENIKMIPAMQTDKYDIKKMVEGRPIERMVPYISRMDRDVAAYLFAIAKKESNWGKYAPKKDGRDCYNYWGYRGTYNQTASGYSCFDSPHQAVKVVGNRIKELASQDIRTPREMKVWKCGHSCQTHDPGSVQKWIDDVGYYFDQVYY